MIGRSGPSPPLLDDPASDLSTLAAGEPPLPLEADETEEGFAIFVDAARLDRFAAAGAVARASAAAAPPVAPRDASARAVEEGIAPESAPPEPPTEPLPPPEPPPWDPPYTLDPGWTVLVGWPPPAVGMLSTYWFTPEFPGGAIVLVWALAGAAATNATDTATPQRLHPVIISSIRLTRAGADTGDSCGAG